MDPSVITKIEGSISPSDPANIVLLVFGHVIETGATLFLTVPVPIGDSSSGYIQATGEEAGYDFGL